MKTIKENLQLRLLCRIWMNFKKHVFLISTEFEVKNISEQLL